MDVSNIKINPRFRDLIPPLSQEEKENLEKSLLEEGCRDAIILWFDTIVDGHNRFELCTKNGIPFQTRNIDFDNENAAEVWILTNQLSRRNITPFTRAQIAIQLKPYYEAKAKENLSNAGKGKAKEAAVNTRKEVAKAAQVSEQTLSRVEKLLENASEEVKAAVSKGEMSINEAYGQLKADNRRAMVRERIEAIKQERESDTEGIVDGNFVCGDSLEELEKLEDGSIHCVITDPPYGINLSNNNCKAVDHISAKVLNDTPDEAFALWDKTCEILSRKMADNTHLYCFTSWKVLGEFKAITEKYFKVCTVLVWNKQGFGQGDTENTWAEQYELCIYAMKGTRPLLSQRQGNVLECKKVSTQQRYHSCEKPLDLIYKFLETSTVEGELVADPFAGSAATLVASKLKGRRYWGCELDPAIFEMAHGRVVLAGTEKGENLAPVQSEEKEEKSTETAE